MHFKNTSRLSLRLTLSLFCSFGVFVTKLGSSTFIPEARMQFLSSTTTFWDFDRYPPDYLNFFELATYSRCKNRRKILTMGGWVGFFGTQNFWKTGFGISNQYNPKKYAHYTIPIYLIFFSRKFICLKISCFSNVSKNCYAFIQSMVAYTWKIQGFQRMTYKVVVVAGLLMALVTPILHMCDQAKGACCCREDCGESSSKVGTRAQCAISPILPPIVYTMN